MPESLPAGRSDRGRGLFKRATHCVKYRLNNAKRKREGNKYIGQHDCTCGKHHLDSMRSQQAPQHSIRAPKHQQSYAGNCGRNRCRQRDGDDQRIASPEVVTREYVSGKQSKDNVEDCGPEARDHRELESKDGIRRRECSPETGQTFARAENEDREERQKDQWQHHEDKHANA